MSVVLQTNSLLGVLVGLLAYGLVFILSGVDKPATKGKQVAWGTLMVMVEVASCLLLCFFASVTLLSVLAMAAVGSCGLVLTVMGFERLQTGSQQDFFTLLADMRRRNAKCVRVLRAVALVAMIVFVLVWGGLLMSGMKARAVEASQSPTSISETAPTQG